MPIRAFSPTLLMCVALSMGALPILAMAGEQAETPDINAENQPDQQEVLPPIDLNTLTIIGYHEITARKDQAVIPDYAVTDKQFELHLDWLQKNGYHFVSVSQIIKAKEGKYKLPTKPVLLTVDDGYQSFYQYAYPIIKKRKIPVVMSVVGSWLETKNNTLVQFGDDQLERALLHKDLKCKAPLIEPNLRRNLGKWST